MGPERIDGSPSKDTRRTTGCPASREHLQSAGAAAGAGVCHDALVDGGQGGERRLHARPRLVRQAVPVLLVSALRLRAAARPLAGGRTGLTQAFFARLMEKNWVGDADRSKGRFRTFLLAAMKHFLADEWDRARAQKRGGGVRRCRSSSPPPKRSTPASRPTSQTPERIFERRWALTLLDQVLERLRAEYERDGKARCSRRCTHPSWASARPSPTRSWPRAGLERERPSNPRCIASGSDTASCCGRRSRARWTTARAVDDELRHLFAALTR